MRQFVAHGELRSTLSLTTDLNVFVCQHQTSTALPRNDPVTHCTGDGVSPMDFPDGRGKSRLPAGIVPPTMQAVTSRYND